MRKEQEQVVYCPWCGKGEVVSEGQSSGAISVKCPKCLRVFRIHLDSMTAEKASARKKGDPRSFHVSAEPTMPKQTFMP